MEINSNGNIVLIGMQNSLIFAFKLNNEYY